MIESWLVIHGILFISIALFPTVLYLALKKINSNNEFMKKIKIGLIFMMIGAWLWAISIIIYWYIIQTDEEILTTADLSKLDNLNYNFSIVAIVSIILILIALLFIVLAIINKRK